MKASRDAGSRGEDNSPTDSNALAGVPAAAFDVTVDGLFRKQVRLRPTSAAIVEGKRSWSYADTARRVAAVAAVLSGWGVRDGDRIAVLSENRHEYLELLLAAAQLGAIAACLSSRLTDDELASCIELAGPKVLVASEQFAASARDLCPERIRTTVLGPAFEELLRDAGMVASSSCARAESPLVIIYTSGTTGRPKGAVVSHRAMIARMAVYQMDLRPRPDEAFIAWTPLYHTHATDFSLATLMLGGVVVVCDGLDLDGIAETVSSRKVSYLSAMPGATARLIGSLRGLEGDVVGVRVVGAMADLVPAHHVAELTELLGAPYVNTYGSTETGLAPASAGLLAAGRVPDRLSKWESSLCEVRLVDPDDQEVPDGLPGEMVVRGPTVFSGYWDASDTNETDFRGGWFHTGDVFARNADGSLEYVDRLKYLIKTGGENVYPAEIERVLLSNPMVEEAVVVRRPDPEWGETPVALVVRSTEQLTAEELFALLGRRLARHKRPRELRFVDGAELPRSTTGKILRHEVERRIL